MVFKAGFVVMAPDADLKKHKAVIKTDKFEQHVVATEMMNFDQYVNACKDLVQKNGVQALILCPGCPHEVVARVSKEVGEGVAISVARGDVPSVMTAFEIFKKEGMLPEGH
jgi:hypothetical protein